MRRRDLKTKETSAKTRAENFKKFGMETLPLQKLTRRWFYASALAAFYVDPFESDFERQLNNVSSLSTADEYAAYFERETGAMLTDDYFRVTLPLNSMQTKLLAHRSRAS